MLALAHLLHEFDFEHDPGYKLDIKEQITLKPSGFELRFASRQLKAQHFTMSALVNAG